MTMACGPKSRARFRTPIVMASINPFQTWRACRASLSHCFFEVRPVERTKPCFLREPGDARPRAHQVERCRASLPPGQPVDDGVADFADRTVSVDDAGSARHPRRRRSTR